jgi:hypothetical protein
VPVNITEFIQPVQVNAIGAPRYLVEAQVKSTIIDICESTGIWRGSETLSLVPGTGSYELSPPSGARLVRVLGVTHGQNKLSLTSEEELDEFYHVGWRSETSEYPGYFFMDSDTSVRLVSAPNEGAVSTADVQYTLKPTRAATTVQDFFFEDYLETVTYGASYRLLEMSDKPWTSLQLAGAFRRLFAQGVSKIRSRAIKSRGKFGGRVKPRSFGDVNGRFSS